MEQAVLGSQQQRLALLSESIETAFAHALLGVGPGEPPLMVAELDTVKAYVSRRIAHCTASPVSGSRPG